MNLDIPKEVKKIISIVEEAGNEIYIVGGAVRDLIMKRPTYDWDFTTNATPDELLKIFDNAFYNNAYGMVGIPSENEDNKPFEITTFRTEHGYTDARRPDSVKWGKTLEQDLERRDFTINAIALKIAGDKNKIIDPFGGQKDIGKKIIRAVGDPNERFGEDALRMMRALRIAAELNFKIDQRTKDAIKDNAKRIHKIAKERIKDELLKMVTSPHAYNTMLEFREVGLMEEILPELEKSFGVEQKSPGRHHIYDVGIHSLMSLKYCPSQDPIVRFATLIHDIGKPETFKILNTGVITFYNHEIAGSKIANRIADRLKFSRKQKEKLYKLVRYHQFTVDEKQTDSAIRRFINNVGAELVPDMLNLRVADRLGGGARETSWRLEEFKSRIIEVQKQPFSIKDLKISGNDVMKALDIKPSPEVGKILSGLYNEVVKNKIPNDKESLLNELNKYAQKDK